MLPFFFDILVQHAWCVTLEYSLMGYKSVVSIGTELDQPTDLS